MPTTPKTRAEYEISPPADSDYSGPRFEYAFPSKPIFPYYSLASCPNGAIYGSFVKGATSLHGTIQYPFELTPQEVKNYNLIDFQRTKEQLAAAEKPFNLSDYEVEPLPVPKLYKFQFPDYEQPDADTYMLGLGTVDNHNNFTGTLKLESSRRDLLDKCDFDAKTDFYRAWNGVNGMGDGHGGYSVAVTSIPITNITLYAENTTTITFPKGATIMLEQSQERITTADIENIFKTNEVQVHHKVDNTEKAVLDNISNLEYFKGYARGMNGLIDKVQNKESMEVVVAEVQMLTNQYNLVTKLNDYHPTYPDRTENPRFLQGQIDGITQGVQTLRGIDITKYIDNAPAQKAEAVPEYPAMSAEEKKEHAEFISVMQKNYPAANPDNLNKLCIIANDMSIYNKQNNSGTLSDEKYNSLIDNQELQIKKIYGELPGAKFHFATDPVSPAIKLDLPQGQNNFMGGFAVPELSANKLAQKKTNELVSPFQNHNATKSQGR